MRLWKAFGGASFILLWFTVIIGPLAKLFRPFGKLAPWRRESGFYFALLALVHGLLILNGWVRWGFYEFFGYQYVAELNTYLRVEPGFGLANMMGLLALLFALVLAIAIFNKVMKFIGDPAWKWLHNFTYVVFYLMVLHAIYFAFIHYTPSPQRILMGMPTNYPDNQLGFFYLGALISVFIAQALSFIKTIRESATK